MSCEARLKIACWTGGTEQESSIIGERVLPMEMLERVFMLLPPRDLKAVKQVCKRWKEAASAPKLWTWVVFAFRLNSEDDDMFSQKMISLPWLQAVREIKFISGFFWNKEFLTHVLCKALNHPGLKKLVIREGDFSTVEPELLANFLTKMEEVNLSDVLLSTEQKRAFLSAFQKTSNKIKILSWEDDKCLEMYREYSQLPNITKKLEKLTLNLNFELSTVQSLFKALKEEDTALRSLCLKIDYFRNIDPVTLSQVVAKLEEVTLDQSFVCANLTVEQYNEISNAVSTDGSKLRKLVLKGEGSLINMKPETLARLTVCLEELDIEGADLERNQTRGMLAAILENPGKLKTLNISRNNLALVDLYLLSGITRLLVNLDLGSTNLRKGSIPTLMAAIAENPGKLKNLILQGNDLSSDPERVIAKMVTKVESLNIAKTELSRDQTEKIFEAIADSPGVLKNLNIDSNDLSKVNPEVLAVAVNRLETIYLSDMPLITQLQMKLILREGLEKGTALKKLAISPERRSLSVFQEPQNRKLYNKLFCA